FSVIMKTDPVPGGSTFSIPKLLLARSPAESQEQYAATCCRPVDPCASRLRNPFSSLLETIYAVLGSPGVSYQPMIPLGSSLITADVPLEPISIRSAPTLRTLREPFFAPAASVTVAVVAGPVSARLPLTLSVLALTVTLLTCWPSTVLTTIASLGFVAPIR